MSIALEGEEVEHCVNKAIERYCVSDLNGDPPWYLVLAEATLPADRLAVLTVPRPDIEATSTRCGVRSGEKQHAK